MNKSCLSLANIEKRIGSKKILSNISFSVGKNEIVGLLGPNGAGKTTAFYIAAGLMFPNQGKVFISNKDVIPLESESSSEIADRLLAAGYQPGRTRSTRLRSKKERTELELFHLVFCDGFEGFDEVGAHVTGHRYILRFVDYASGSRKSYSCATKDKFPQALQMYLAWI